MPFFSVVVTVYNKSQYIGKTITGILNQSFDDFEIIIVNDGSTDNSLEVINSIKDKRISVFSTKNQGVSAARNYGLHKANCKTIALSDGDDIWLPNHLTELKALIDTFPNCGIYATSYEKHFFESYVTQPRFSFVNHPFFGIVDDYFSTSLADNILWTSAVAIPKPIVNKGFVFDERIGCGEDIDLWISIAKSYKVAFSSKSTACKMIYAKDNHLSLTKNIPDLISVIYKHQTDEKDHPSLKSYLDINRFSIAMEAKLRNDFENYKKMKNDIDFSNINTKLRLLLSLPAHMLRLLKRIKFFLLKKKLYQSPF